MSDRSSELAVAGDNLNRREFVRAGVSLVGSALVVACGGKGGAGGAGPTPTGSVNGIVLDLQGVAQANFGQAILMFSNGRHVGVRATPDSAG